LVFGVALLMQENTVYAKVILPFGSAIGFTLVIVLCRFAERLR
jgi:Na+-translocating ferredoxin:NAD+ oxidoreductase RnfA subunit